jgi:hypothetical protein
MTKASASKPVAKQLKGSAQPEGGAKIFPPAIEKTRFEAVMQAAEQSGLLAEKSGRIGGRVSSALVRQAKRQTGIASDTELIEFALASVALEDNFAEVFRRSRGTVDPELKLGF